MFKFSLAAIAALAVTACGTAMNFSAPPSAWSSETLSHFHNQGRGIQCRILQNAKARSNSPEDSAFITNEYRRLGLNKRDIEVLNDPEHIYGTGMSFAGLECAAGSNLGKNTAFYPGSGHQWQVPFGSGYVYLRGDGTDQGMKVYAWN
jgi:hypothetical protein